MLFFRSGSRLIKHPCVTFAHLLFRGLALLGIIHTDVAILQSIFVLRFWQYLILIWNQRLDSNCMYCYVTYNRICDTVSLLISFPPQCTSCVGGSLTVSSGASSWSSSSSHSTSGLSRMSAVAFLQDSGLLKWKRNLRNYSGGGITSMTKGSPPGFLRADPRRTSTGFLLLRFANEPLLLLLIISCRCRYFGRVSLLLPLFGFSSFSLQSSPSSLNG